MSLEDAGATVFAAMAAMSDEQLSALLDQLAAAAAGKDDGQSAADLSQAAAMAGLVRSEYRRRVEALKLERLGRLLGPSKSK